jgi:FlaA1/EpsC-like NDP-sugar epimerase
VTDPEMTRFIMSIEEAVRLIINAGELSRGGEVFVTKMPAIRIKDLAEVMIRELAPGYGRKPEDIKIQIIGHKAGEKMYEELMNIEETRRSWELERYFVILPAFTDIYREIVYEYPDIKSREVTRSYQSDNEEPLSKNQLAAFLKKNNIL